MAMVGAVWRAVGFVMLKEIVISSNAATLFSTPSQSVNEISKVFGTHSPMSTLCAVRFDAGQNRGRVEAAPSTRSPTRLEESTDTALSKQHRVIFDAPRRSTLVCSAAVILFLVPASTELCVRVFSVKPGRITRRGSAPAGTPSSTAPVLVTGAAVKAAVPLAAMRTTGESCAASGFVIATWIVYAADASSVLQRGSVRVPSANTPVLMLLMFASPQNITTSTPSFLTVNVTLFPATAPTRPVTVMLDPAAICKSTDATRAIVTTLGYPARGDDCVKSRTVNSGTTICSGSVPLRTPKRGRPSFCISRAANCTALDPACDITKGERCAVAGFVTSNEKE
mmetsp:Transcript_54556/g.129588  ORF Transcript_54556/g.129588 Transcript_54556/m.129588 type:complete len:339 (+) Transcript_54556:2279-3295(+)